MNKYVVIFVPITVIAFAVLAFVSLGNNKCIRSEVPGAGGQVVTSNNIAVLNNKEDDCCVQKTSAGKYSENSIFQLKTVWKDQTGKDIMLNQFMDKKVVMALIYTNCPTACPVIVNKIQSLESLIDKKTINDYRFVLVSIDPIRDTPQELRKFAEEKNLDLHYWTLLTGSENDIAELAQMVGFKYRRNKSGSFTHSNLITFINKAGEIENQSEGLNQDTEKLLAMLNN
jgi:protein SCO1/2